jgi:hypothetical protein
MQFTMKTLPEHLLQLFQSHIGPPPENEDEIDDIIECDGYKKCRCLVVTKFYWEALQEAKLIIVAVSGTHEKEVFIPSIFRGAHWSVIPHGSSSMLIIISHMMFEQKDWDFWKQLVDAYESWKDESLVECLIQFGYCQMNEEVCEAIGTIVHG